MLFRIVLKDSFALLLNKANHEKIISMALVNQRQRTSVDSVASAN
jgi:hypothetical protein